MSSVTVVTDLYCLSCLQTTTHEVKYVAGLLHRVDCRACGEGWDIGHRWLWHHYLRHLPIRLISKPARLADEARRHPFSFALRLPSRLASKPVRMASEVGAIAGLGE
jgi:hypothetical protein